MSFSKKKEKKFFLSQSIIHILIYYIYININLFKNYFFICWKTNNADRSTRAVVDGY